MRSVADTQPDFSALREAGHRQDRMMEPVSLTQAAGGGSSHKVCSVNLGAL